VSPPRGAAGSGPFGRSLGCSTVRTIITISAIAAAVTTTNTTKAHDRPEVGCGGAGAVGCGSATPKAGRHSRRP